MAHREQTELKSNQTRLQKHMLMLKLGEKKWRAGEKVKVDALKQQLEADLRNEIAISAENNVATSTEAAARENEKSVQAMEASSHARHTKWRAMHRKQMNQLEVLNQKATDSVSTAEEEVEKMTNKKATAPEIATLRMLEKSKADQEAFGQLLKKSTAVQQILESKLVQLNSTNAEAAQRAADEQEETGEMIAARQKHAAASEQAVAAKAQLAKSAELRYRQQLESASIQQEAAEEQDELDKISSAREQVQTQIKVQQAAANQESKAKTNTENAQVAETASKEQSIEDHATQQAQQLSAKEASWNEKLSSQLTHIASSKQLALVRSVRELVAD